MANVSDKARLRDAELNVHHASHNLLHAWTLMEPSDPLYEQVRDLFDEVTALRHEMGVAHRKRYPDRK